MHLELILAYYLLVNHQSLVGILLAPLSTHDLDFLNHNLAITPPILVTTQVKLLLLHFKRAFKYFVLGWLAIKVLLAQHLHRFTTFEFNLT